jgi:tRNA (cmo5U34)-methyltransferase
MAAPHHHHRIASGFDRLAPWYDRLVELVFGGSVAQIQVDLLPCLPEQGRVLVVGGGTGWLLGELFRLRPQLTVTYVELSPRMLARAQRVAAAEGLPAAQLTWQQGRVSDLPPGPAFDAVLTFFFLDLFSAAEVRVLMDQIERRLRPRAQWLLADFVAQNAAQRALLAAMYGFFRLMCSITGDRQLPFVELFEGRSYRLAAQYRRWCGMVRGMDWRRANEGDLPASG